MKTICSWCEKELSGDAEDTGGEISHGICEKCAFHLRASRGMELEAYIRGLHVPVVAVDRDGVVQFASEKMKTDLAKTDSQITGLPGGTVFECDYSYLPGGCGRTVHCDACKIRNSVMETHRRGTPGVDLNAVLRQRKPDGNLQHVQMTFSTEKTGDVVLLRIENAELVELT